MEETKNLKTEMKKEPKISETEKKQVELVMKCADMIKSSFRISAMMQQAVHMEPQDIFASITMAVGDFIVASADGSHESRKKLVTEFTKVLKDYVMNAPKEEGDKEFS